MQLFYAPNINTQTYILDKDESKHCITVLRKQKGDFVQLIDGKGSIFTAKISEANPKKCILNVSSIKKIENDILNTIHIAIAPTKNSVRFEWFLEKATEIGISSITPIICKHSERKVIKNERLKNVLINAMKQCNRAYLPTLNALTHFDDFISKQFEGEAYIAHCQSDKKPLFKEVLKKHRNVIVLIGPEGDFSSSEIKKANKNGYKSVSLGNSRLRTETAGLVACHISNLINQ